MKINKKQQPGLVLLVAGIASLTARKAAQVLS